MAPPAHLAGEAAGRLLDLPAAPPPTHLAGEFTRRAPFQRQHAAAKAAG